MSDVFREMDGITPADVAERWLARLMAPDCSLKDKERFEAWLRSAPEHALAYEDAQALWISLGGLEEDAVVGPHVAEALQPARLPVMEQWTAAAASITPRRRSNARRSWTPLGAGIAATIIIGLAVWPGMQPQAPMTPYVATTSIRDVRLSDGSRVQLDLGARITTRIDERSRSIELTSGRAMFEVAHDAVRPFVVDVGVGSVTALGTQFQVLRSGQALSVTLLEGSVSIDNRKRGAEQGSLRLVPGQIARYASSTKSWTVANIDAAETTSWSQGFHVFTATPLGEAIVEINRYSAVKLELDDPGLSDLRLSGSYKLGDAAVIAQALPYAVAVRVMERDGVIKISKK